VTVFLSFDEADRQSGDVGPSSVLVSLVAQIRMPRLFATLVARPWRSHIHRGILLEETGRFEHKASIRNGHYRPVLRPWDMVHAE
jgi:hypothetical protein